MTAARDFSEFNQADDAKHIQPHAPVNIPKNLLLLL
jgi:hypothetical protein